MFTTILLGVTILSFVSVGGYALWYGYHKLGIVNTIFYAIATPLMIHGLITTFQSMMRQVSLLAQNELADVPLFATVSPSLLLGLGILTSSLLWTVVRCFFQSKLKQHRSRKK